MAPQYHMNTKGLLISGKDDQSVLAGNRRVRIRFNPLSIIGDWPRCIQLKQTDGSHWFTTVRTVNISQVANEAPVEG